MEKIKNYHTISLYNFGKDKLYCCLDDGLYECIPIRSEYSYKNAFGYVYVQTCMGEQRVSPLNIYATPEDACRQEPYIVQSLKMEELFKDWRWDSWYYMEGYSIKNAKVGYISSCWGSISADATGVHIQFQTPTFRTKEEAENELAKSVKVVSLDGNVSYGVKPKPRKTRTINVHIKVFEY